MKPATLIELQRKAALDHMGEQARILLRQGYPEDANAVLDAMIARREAWRDECDEPAA